MFDTPFDFFALLIAVVAFIFARKALNQAATLRARLDAVEAAWQARPVAPPLTPLQEFEQTLATASPGIAAEQPPTVRRRTDRAGRGRSTGRAASCRRRRPGRDAAAASASPARLRGAHRHPLGGLDRRPDAGARRLLHGPLFDRGRPARPRRAHAARRRVRARAAGGRRMDAPQGEHFGHRGAADRQHPGDPHRRRHRGRLRDRLCRLRAVRFSRARHRVHPARAGGAGHARRRAAARPGAGRPRRRRRLRHADPGVVGEARLLGALHLSRHRHRCGLRAGADPAVALARGHHHRRSRCCGPSPASNAGRRWSGRTTSMSSPASFSRRCSWCADSCSARRPTRAGSSRSRPVRSRPICSAQQSSYWRVSMPMPP